MNDQFIPIYEGLHQIAGKIVERSLRIQLLQNQRYRVGPKTQEEYCQQIYLKALVKDHNKLTSGLSFLTNEEGGVFANFEFYQSLVRTAKNYCPESISEDSDE